MNQHSRLPATIRARVYAGAIDRVTRFYANSLADTFSELLQNARRSRATRLDVTTEAAPDQGIRVTVTDDGEGIADPAVLLSFGESGWDDTTARREDPAGMGIHALSRRGCAITSRNHDAAFWRAAERAGLAPTLFEPDSRLEGYDWYDGLAKVHSIVIDITCGGVTHSLDALRAGAETPRSTGADPRPDAIHVRLPVQRGAAPVRTIALAADLAFLGEDWWSDLQDTGPLVTADSTMEPHVLALLLRNAFFCPGDDPDADSYETQKTRFQDDAMHLALTLLASEEDAKKHTIAETIHREVLWAIPRDRDVSITVSGGRVGIEFGPGPAQAEGVPA